MMSFLNSGELSYRLRKGLKEANSLVNLTIGD